MDYYAAHTNDDASLRTASPLISGNLSVFREQGRGKHLAEELTSPPSRICGSILNILSQDPLVGPIRLLAFRPLSKQTFLWGHPDAWSSSGTVPSRVTVTGAVSWLYSRRDTWLRVEPPEWCYKLSWFGVTWIIYIDSLVALNPSFETHTLLG